MVVHMKLSEATAKKPERTKPRQSKTVKASAATVAASAGTAVTSLSGMNETSQYNDRLLASQYCSDFI